MQKYDVYKKSGIEWIGEIPIDWQVMRLRYRGKSIIGITYKPEQVVSNKEEGILVLRSSNVQNGKLDFNDNVYVDKEINENQLTKEGDILVCARNGSAHLVGKSAYIPKEWENVTFGAFMSIVRTDLDKFLFYYFNSQVFKGQKGLFATSTINQLTSKMLNNLDIPIPPSKSKQTQIATYLDRKTTEIDQLIADKKALVDLYKEEKTAIINQAVTRGINPDAKMKDSGIEWLGDVPEHWEVNRLIGISSFVRGNSSFKKDELLSNGNYVALQYGKTYKVHEVNDSFEFYVNDEFYKDSQIVNYGDVIIISTSETIEDLGHSAYYNRTDLGLLGGEQFVLKPKKEKIDGKYLYYSSKVFTKELQKFARGIKVLRFNIGNLKTIYTSVPPIEEQTQIVRYIEQELARIDTKTATVEQYIILLTEYRTALISEVVTGKIKVTNEI